MTCLSLCEATCHRLLAARRKVRHADRKSGQPAACRARVTQQPDRAPRPRLPAARAGSAVTTCVPRDYPDRRCHPHRLPARLHQGRDRVLPHQLIEAGSMAEAKSKGGSAWRPGVRHAGRRRRGVPAQRLSRSWSSGVERGTALRTPLVDGPAFSPPASRCRTVPPGSATAGGPARPCTPCGIGAPCGRRGLTS
jgi:hypothetical protein